MKEKKLKEKEKEYKDVVAMMAQLVLEDNESILGSDMVEKAKEKISTKNTKKKKSESKEGVANDQEKAKRTGRTRKSA